MDKLLDKFKSLSTKGKIIVVICLFPFICIIGPFYWIWKKTKLVKTAKIALSVFLIILFGVAAVYSAKEKEYAEQVVTKRNTDITETIETEAETMSYSESVVLTELITEAVIETTTMEETIVLHNINEELTAKENMFYTVFDDVVNLEKGDPLCIIGSTKEGVYKLLKGFSAEESFLYMSTDIYVIRFENDLFGMVVYFTEDWIAEGVYIEAMDVDDPITGEGSNVYERYDEIVALATGGQDIEVSPDTEYANLTQTKKYPMALIIGDTHE
ncbi:MAG: hypothetical protein J6K17_10490 [Oscillospiraceae bacterium]|nr:hypothetical protein [Oscillospiraceae bacterium]